MITAVVLFKLQPGTTRDQAAAIYRTTAPRYVGLGDLVRKYYLYDAADGTAGGVYLWKSRAAAEAAYGPEWRRMAAEKYGVEPEVRYFDTPVVVDNTAAPPIAEHPPG
jgi:hypothetical protein